jgi:hypothetical protein
MFRSKMSRSEYSANQSINSGVSQITDYQQNPNPDTGRVIRATHTHVLQHNSSPTSYATGLLLISPLGDLVPRRPLLLALVLCSASLHWIGHQQLCHRFRGVVISCWCRHRNTSGKPLEFEGGYYLLIPVPGVDTFGCGPGSCQ